MGLWEILKGEQPGIIKTLLNYENTGQFGEFSTEFALTNHNLDGNFIVLKNVYVPIKGKTTEIDLFMIHEKGLFVFESKNYSGWIFGTNVRSAAPSWFYAKESMGHFTAVLHIRNANSHDLQILHKAAVKLSLLSTVLRSATNEPQSLCI